MDCDIQDWHEKMLGMSKLRTLSMYKLEFCTEQYLYLNMPQRLRSFLAKFRIGNHELEIERGRHQNIPVSERICKLCFNCNNVYVEDEYHVILQCPSYEELRLTYLNINNKPQNLHTFIALMSVQNNQLVNLANFVTNMFKLRKVLLSSQLVETLQSSL